MRKIAVLTYPVKHRKTFDLISILNANGYKDVMVCAVPLHYKKSFKPLYEHRPEMNYCVPDTKIICENLGYVYKEGAIDSFKIEKDRVVLVAGAGIIPDNFIKEHTIINAHPGYIPNCRGLDSYKWAIHNKEPIGVTTHLIGKHVDAGFLIDRRKICVYKSDTFHAVAERVYENEVSMLVEAINKCDDDLIEVLPGDSILHKRMSAEIENNLLEEFEEYKDSLGIDRIE